jgi:hypothetical protein
LKAKAKAKAKGDLSIISVIITWMKTKPNRFEPQNRHHRVCHHPMDEGENRGDSPAKSFWIAEINIKNYLL